MEELLNGSETFYIELTITFIIAFIGSFTHEYLTNDGTDRSIIKNPNVWLSTIISTILCYIIDPWVMEFSPRLMFLPPLILGLVGMDLVKRLTTLKGSTGLLEYILTFFGIRRVKDGNESGIPDNDSKDGEKVDLVKHKRMTEEETKFIVLLENMTQICYNAINGVLVEYYTRHDNTAFLYSYSRIKSEQEIIRTSISLFNAIPMSTSLKLSELLKKSMELDAIYNDIVASSTSN